MIASMCVARQNCHKSVWVTMATKYFKNCQKKRNNLSTQKVPLKFNETQYMDARKYGAYVWNKTK